jgi:hypothetical protein
MDLELERSTVRTYLAQYPQRDWERKDLLLIKSWTLPADAYRNPITPSNILNIIYGW